MRYNIIFSDLAKRQIEDLDKVIQIRIASYLNKASDNSKLYGELLVVGFKGLRRYRVGDYRIICDVRDQELIVFVVKIGHRSKVYDR